MQKLHKEFFVNNLKQEIDLDSIDYIITNHCEIDHSGSLPKLIKHIPETPIYCTKNAIDSLKGQFHGVIWRDKPLQILKNMQSGQMTTKKIKLQ